MRIGTLAAHAGVGPKTVRYYESIGLMPAPPRTLNGYRSYSDMDLAQLRFIRRAQAAGLSLQAIRDILIDHSAGIQTCRQVQMRAEEQIAAIDQRIAELQAVRRSLVDLAARADALAHDGSCNTAEICSALS